MNSFLSYLFRFYLFSIGQKLIPMIIEKKILFQRTVFDGIIKNKNFNMIYLIKTVKMTKIIKKIFMQAIFFRSFKYRIFFRRKLLCLGLDPDYLEYLKSKKQKALEAEQCMTDEQKQSMFLVCEEVNVCDTK